MAGRVGSHALAKLETELACRKRVFSEERGMRASGREASGEVRSVLGFLASELGPAPLLRRHLPDVRASRCSTRELCSTTST